MSKNLEDYPDRVAEMYKNKIIFITGGTGFMGKVLVEKLLRSCTDLKKIILMVRSKKGKQPDERIKELLSGPLFNMVKKQKGEDIIKKIETVVGDVMLPNLGICAEDRKKLTNEVEIIFHCAATIRFDDHLTKAILLNVRGTKFMLDLAKECKKLLCFAYMSTAYCHLKERILYEKPYPPPTDPHSLIKVAEHVNKDMIEMITPHLLGNDIANTYTYTKALSEALVVEQKDNLPIIILRPSIVIPIWKEPIPGWTDNVNGPTAILIPVGQGIIKTMYCNANIYADYIPVDIAVNATILCVWNFINIDRKTFVYHLTTSAEHKITMGEIFNSATKVATTKMPLSGVFWYPSCSLKRSKTVHLIYFFLFNLVPAVLVDAFATVLGRKPILYKLQKRIWKCQEVYEPYTNNQWDFDTQHSQKARENFNPRERATYKCDGDGIDICEYITACARVARLYILKETDETLPAAKKHLKVLWLVDKISKILLFVGVIYYVYQKIFIPILST